MAVNFVVSEVLCSAKLLQTMYVIVVLNAVMQNSSPARCNHFLTSRQNIYLNKMKLMKILMFGSELLYRLPSVTHSLS